MPSDAGPVGGVQIPVAAGAEKERFADPIVDALLDFAAFYIKNAIDVKLKQLTGTSTDAVPANNRFAFNPLEPRGHQVKLPRPSLFVFWEGQSSQEQQTILYTVRRRTIEFLYAFDELPHFEEMERRVGLYAAVDAAMHQMSVRQVHQDFATNDDPDGSWISTSVADINLVDWRWQGSLSGRFGIDEGPRAERRFAKKSGRDWPALKGSWLVEERIGLQTMQDPQDLLPDVAATIRGSDGESTDTVEMISGVLQAPDGECE